VALLEVVETREAGHPGGLFRGLAQSRINLRWVGACHGKGTAGPLGLRTRTRDPARFSGEPTESHSRLECEYSPAFVLAGWSSQS
jgi:hypothetical protein